MESEINLLGIGPVETGARQAARAEQFAQANASLALEGLFVDQTDLQVQEAVAKGTLTAEEAIDLYRKQLQNRSGEGSL